MIMELLKSLKRYKSFIVIELCILATFIQHERVKNYIQITSIGEMKNANLTEYLRLILLVVVHIFRLSIHCFVCMITLKIYLVQNTFFRK